jgi:adenylate cyclase
MKFSFHITLLTILLSLVCCTVLGLGFLSYHNAHATTTELSRQILDQTSLRIDARIDDFLHGMRDLGAMNLRLLETGQVRVDDFPRLAPYWLEVMKVHPRLTSLSLGLEATGEWFYVRRLPDDRLAIGELRRNGRTDKLELSNYWPEAYPGEPFYFNPDASAEDPRTRPWYRAGRTSGKQAWSETYVLFGVEGVPDMPGVSCATPFYRPAGRLVGVVTATFDMRELSDYLKGLAVGHRGYAFVLEYRADGSRHVIAHPDASILIRGAREEGTIRVRELVPAEQTADARVPAFLEQVPGDRSTAGQKAMTRVRFTQGGVRYLGSHRGLQADGSPPWVIGVVIPEAEILQNVDRNNRHTLLLGLAVLTGAVLVSLGVARQVARPLERLAREAAAIGRWHLEPRPPARSLVEEVHRLAVANENMKTSLRSFSKYVPADLVRTLLAAGQEARLGGENRRVTILFADLAGFTSITEQLAPAQLVEHLSEYLQVMSAEVLATAGTLDKYIGDAVMAFWGAPVARPQHALDACRAALGCRQRMEQLRARWKAEGKPLLFARLGLHTGEVVVGNIGSEARLNYTVIGDAVNLASRMEGLNKYYGTEILITDSTRRAIGDALVVRPVDWVSVKGKTRPVQVYELLGAKGEVGGAIEALVELHDRALALYRLREWARARALFEQILEGRPHDGPARALMARCREYQAHPPGDGWDGVHRMESK